MMMQQKFFPLEQHGYASEAAAETLVKFKTTPFLPMHMKRK